MASNRAKIEVDTRMNGFRMSALFWAVAFSALGLPVQLRSVQAATEIVSGEPVQGEAIKTFVAGKRIYLSVPLGGEMPLHYRQEGIVDGSGEAIGLGKFFAPRDQGRWWVRDNSLCQQWESWYSGKVFCFTLESLPDNKLVWRRDDGEVGIARIGN